MTAEIRIIPGPGITQYDRTVYVRCTEGEGENFLSFQRISLDSYPSYPWDQHKNALNHWRIYSIACMAIAVLTAFAAMYISSTFLGILGFLISLKSVILFRDTKVMQKNFSQMRSNPARYFIQNQSLCKKVVQKLYPQKDTHNGKAFDDIRFIESYVGFMDAYVEKMPEDHHDVTTLSQIVAQVQNLSRANIRSKSILCERLSEMAKNCHKHLCSDPRLYFCLLSKLFPPVVRKAICKGSWLIPSSRV